MRIKSRLARLAAIGLLSLATGHTRLIGPRNRAESAHHVYFDLNGEGFENYVAGVVVDQDRDMYPEFIAVRRAGFSTWGIRYFKEGAAVNDPKYKIIPGFTKPMYSSIVKLGRKKLMEDAAVNSQLLKEGASEWAKEVSHNL